MAKKKLKINLFDQKSINDAVEYLNSYKTTLKSQVQTFVNRLAEEGLKVVNSTMESIPSDEQGSYYTEVINNTKGDIIGAALRLSGNQVLFLEFSSGIRYGTNYYPTDAGSKYGMGTYPGKGHWSDPNGWWYIDENGDKHHSYGNRAYMPMYHAEQAVIFQVSAIAREVFGG